MGNINNEKEKITEQSKADRKTELAKLRKNRFLERQKNLDKDNIDYSSIKCSKELARTVTKIPRQKKIEWSTWILLTLLQFLINQQSMFNLNNENQHCFLDSQRAGPFLLNVSFIHNKNTEIIPSH